MGVLRGTSAGPASYLCTRASGVGRGVARAVTPWWWLALCLGHLCLFLHVVAASAPAGLGGPKVSAELHAAPSRPRPPRSRETPCHGCRQRPSAKQLPLLCQLPSLPRGEGSWAMLGCPHCCQRTSAIRASLLGPNSLFQHHHFSFPAPSPAVLQMMLTRSHGWCAGEGSQRDL